MPAERERFVVGQKYYHLFTMWGGEEVIFMFAGEREVHNFQLDESSLIILPRTSEENYSCSFRSLFFGKYPFNNKVSNFFVLSCEVSKLDSTVFTDPTGIVRAHSSLSLGSFYFTSLNVDRRLLTSPRVLWANTFRFLLSLAALALITIIKLFFLKFPNVIAKCSRTRDSASSWGIWWVEVRVRSTINVDCRGWMGIWCLTNNNNFQFEARDSRCSPSSLSLFSVLCECLNASRMWGLAGVCDGVPSIINEAEFLLFSLKLKALFDAVRESAVSCE